MKHLFLAALCLGLFSGCGSSTKPADLDQAGPALRTALEVWKSGSSQKELESQNPPILMNEDDWREGKHLMDYKMEEAGRMYGRQVVWWVQINLKDKNGKTEDRRAKYVIDTTPQLVIVRDRFAR